MNTRTHRGAAATSRVAVLFTAMVSLVVSMLAIHPAAMSAPPDAPPETEAPAPTEPPVTEAPAPTDPPVTEAPAPPDPPVTEAPTTEAPPPPATDPPPTAPATEPVATEPVATEPAETEPAETLPPEPVIVGASPVLLDGVVWSENFEAAGSGPIGDYVGSDGTRYSPIGAVAPCAGLVMGYADETPADESCDWATLRTLADALGQWGSTGANRAVTGAVTFETALDVEPDRVYTLAVDAATTSCDVTVDASINGSVAFSSPVDVCRDADARAGNVSIVTAVGDVGVAVDGDTVGLAVSVSGADAAIDNVRLVDVTPAEEPATSEPVMAAAEEDALIAPMALAGPPVHEIEGSWVNPPATISRGNPVVAEWRVNVNDSGDPPGNDPVDNVVVEFNLDKAFFDEIPDLCETEAADPPVDPPSSISPDGMTLVCNLGTVNAGTAVVVQTPVVANGITGEFVTHDGTIDGQTVVLPPIEIVNPFIMDIEWVGVTDFRQWDDIFNPTAVDLDLTWSLRMGSGSDPGPDTVTYQLTVVTQDNSPVQIGAHPSDRGQPDNFGVEGCTSYDFGGNAAAGHPFSSVPEHFRHTNFVDSCTLTQTGANTFTLTLTGIDYDLVNKPTHDAQNNPLPPDWDYVASGSVWFRVLTSAAGSVQLTSSAPTYTAPTGQTFDDLPGNNASTKAYTLPGGWSSGWQRSYTFSGGSNWDGSYRVPAGTTVNAFTNNTGGTIDAAPGSTWGNCLAFDTAFVTYQGHIPRSDDHPVFENQIRGYPAVGQENPGGPFGLDNPPAIQYFTGAVGNPDTFDCGTGGWSTDPPANLANVTAIRIVYPHSLYEDEGWAGIQLQASVMINDDVPTGQDVWTFGSALRNGTWVGPGNPNVITPTPGARYPQTNGRRDIVRIVLADPNIRKAAAQATVTPGVPADFTLEYAATGSGLIPDTVDGFQVEDTLPVGMTYEPGSADPEPVVTSNQGQQVLTWTFDGVTTNEWHELTYQAVPDADIPPGTVLTNTAVSSLAGEESAPRSASVTTTANGYTLVLKTADVEYIPNPMGDGVGTGSWTVQIDSFDPQPQAYTDTIDILPYNGDGRGTSFNGTYALDEVVLLDGGTVYYTDADPATLSDDPADPSNGSAGDVAGNTVGWTTTAPENPTAIRVIGGQLAPGGTFAFQVVITTDGAQPQDVYWNRAQARAGHTELVMRTSAPLIVTDYVVEKTSDPPSGSSVEPGDVITYTVTVTQVGDVPAGGLFTDTLTQVFDDAVYNDDVDADIGTATIVDDLLSWEGDVPVGEVATITYSVTVKDLEALAAEGDTFLKNVVWSPGGCLAPGEPGEGCTEEHFTGWYDYSKTSDPASDSVVQVGDVVTYHVQIVQEGEGAVADARITDDLSEVLDDATWNDDIEVNIGAASLEGTTLTWQGDLEPGDVVDLTYSVTVTKDGDFELLNVVTNDDPTRSRCLPAPDENPDCTTRHTLGDYETVKTSDPENGSAVYAGDTVTYTVTVTHIGLAPVPDAWFEDDMTEVLDDATYNDDAAASDGATSYAEPVLRWDGEIEEGDEVTVTYSVTVTAEGDRHLVNVVTTGGQCVPAEGQDEACTTEHFAPGLEIVKVTDRTAVGPNDTVTYTITATNDGNADFTAANPAELVDDLTDVLDDATWLGNASASHGTLSFSSPELTWTGPLAVGETVTITYAVQINSTVTGSGELHNTVTGVSGASNCPPGAPAVECETVTQVASAAPPAPSTPGPIPVTG